MKLGLDEASLLQSGCLKLDFSGLSWPYIIGCPLL